MTATKTTVRSNETKRTMAKKKDKGVAILHAEAITEEFIQKCDEYLLELKCTLWGRAFDVYDATSRRQAAEFLAANVVGLMVTS